MLSWAETQQIIESKQLSLLLRTPAQSESYAAAKQRFLKSHGGTAEFVIKERLQWDGDALHPVGDAFLGDPCDVKILINDFSYDFEPGVRHFVVWSKIRIPCGTDEFPTPEAAATIEQFLKKQFTDRANVRPENLLWFKNTSALQSIPSVSHFHVLVRHCTPEQAQIILGDLKE